MKSQPKPIRLLRHPEIPAIQLVVESTTAPKAQLMEQSYQQLVTKQGVPPERAKQLLEI